MIPARLQQPCPERSRLLLPSNGQSESPFSEAGGEKKSADVTALHHKSALRHYLEMCDETLWLCVCVDTGETTHGIEMYIQSGFAAFTHCAFYSLP